MSTTSLNSWKFNKFDWVQGTATIATECGTEEVRAYRTAMIPGLAITQGVFGLWSITQDASGWCFTQRCKFEVLENAVRALEENCVGLDWWAPDLINPRRNCPERFREAVRAVCLAADEEQKHIGYCV